MLFYFQGFNVSSNFSKFIDDIQFLILTSQLYLQLLFSSYTEFCLFVPSFWFLLPLIISILCCFFPRNQFFKNVTSIKFYCGHFFSISLSLLLFTYYLLPAFFVWVCCPFSSPFPHLSYYLMEKLLILENKKERKIGSKYEQAAHTCGLEIYVEIPNFLEIRKMIHHAVSIRLTNIRELCNSLCQPGLGRGERELIYYSCFNSVKLFQRGFRQ